MARVLVYARWFLVTVGIVLLTSITVDATISPGGMSQSALGIFATSLTEQKKGDCKEGMVRLGGDYRTVCVDIYEASPSEECSHRVIGGAQDTRTNMSESGCMPVSQRDTHPWTFVTLQQAHELCARADKRLLSNAEWYRASLGTPDTNDTTCNVRSQSALKTGTAQCASQAGVSDAVGNVWEWVDGEIHDGVYGERQVPQSGYVTEADSDGVALVTGTQASQDYYADYFWSESQGDYGVLRGGFYGSGDDAGVYSIQGKTARTFAGAAVGFRCAHDSE